MKYTKSGQPIKKIASIKKNTHH